MFLTGCVGLSSKGVFGTGVSVAFDPRSLGTQIDDSVMQKNLTGRLLLTNKSYLISVKTKVLDGRIFLTGKVDDPEEKLHIEWDKNGTDKFYKREWCEENNSFYNVQPCCVFPNNPGRTELSDEEKQSIILEKKLNLENL